MLPSVHRRLELKLWSGGCYCLLKETVSGIRGCLRRIMQQPPGDASSDDDTGIAIEVDRDGRLAGASGLDYRTKSWPSFLMPWEVAALCDDVVLLNKLADVSLPSEDRLDASFLLQCDRMQRPRCFPGAALTRSCVIASSTCVLPLALRTADTDTMCGIRHRARRSTHLRKARRRRDVRPCTFWR